MINSFEIENFRLFDKLKINRFGRVNLIVGKNNVGKSAILEALVLFFSRASFDEILRALDSRQENFVQAKNTESIAMNMNPIRYLFRNYTVPEIGTKGIKISCNDGIVLEIKKIAYIYEEEGRIITLKRIEPEEIDNYDLNDINIQIRIVCEYDGNEIRKIPLLYDEFEGRASKPQILFPKAKIDIVPYQLIPTQGLTDRKASSMWDKISLTSTSEDVLTCLKILEPSVTGLGFVGDENGSPEKRIPMIKMENIEQPIPLKSLGDGMSRIFQIILSLVNAKNGALLIDEFENGLHWSVQEKVWKTVFELSEKLNVQVFASTHSTDCINTFQKVWETDENAGAFIRLSKKGEEIVATEYDLELLKDSVETDVEVR